MKAVVVEQFGEPSDLVIKSVDDLVPGPGEVVVTVHIAALNFPDLLVVRGEYQTLPTLPFVPGKEAVGIVTAVGEGVADAWLGKRVIAMVDYGSLAEQLIAPAAVLVEVPDEISSEQAAAFGLVYRTAYFALIRRAQLQPGETVLVTGVGGGAGSAAVAFAKWHGARVFAVVRDEHRVQLALDQGADEVIVTARESIRERVKELTAGAGVDVVFEVVGADVLQECIRATGFEGRVIMVGFAGGTPKPIQPGHLLVKNMSVHGTVSAAYRDRMPEVMSHAVGELLEIAKTGHLPIPIDSVHAIDDVVAGFARFTDGGLRGKVLVKVVEA